MASATRSTQRRQTLRTGPFKGVQNTRDPYDDQPNLLVDALNCYLPDPIGGSGFYARPGFLLANPSSALAGRGQGVYAHTSLANVTTNFVVCAGVLYRVDAGLTGFTDVSPVGITIDPTATHVYFTSFGDYLVVSDGVNEPWLASDLSSTPITGTAIDYDGMGTAWSAYGRPTIYKGSVFFILNMVGGVGRRTDIAWSAPGDPSVGYQQPDYDFNWTLEQSGSQPLYAIWGTNVSLFYWRAGSVGAINGTPGPDLSTTATGDALAVNVGTLQSATIQQYGDTIFFCDQTGRPWMMPIGGVPQPIWLSLRGVLETSTVAYPSATAQVAVSVLDPGLNLYIAAIWSPTPAIANAPVEAQVFDAKTGVYVGRWVIGPGIGLDALGVLNNTSGRSAIVALGTKIAPPATTGYVWTGSGGGDDSGTFFFETEDAAFLLTTEDGDLLTTENEILSWLDDGEPPTRRITTQRFGYSDDTVWNADQVTIVNGSNAPCTVTVQSPTTAGSVEGTPSPSVSQDGTWRLVAGVEVQGRGIQVLVEPTTADDQWSAQSVSIAMVASRAGPEDA